MELDDLHLHSWDRGIGASDSFYVFAILFNNYRIKNKLSDEFIQRVNIREDGWKENETASTGVLRIIENKETKFGEQSYSNWVKCMGRFFMIPSSANLATQI